MYECTTIVYTMLDTPDTSTQDCH